MYHTVSVRGQALWSSLDTIGSTALMEITGMAYQETQASERSICAPCIGLAGSWHHHQCAHLILGWQPLWF